NATLTNLKKAINLEAGAGTFYGTSTVIHPTVTAISVVGDVLTVRAKTIGSVGNLIVTSLVSALNVYWGWTTLVDGTDSEQTGIEMYFKKIINHGTKLTTKIPDMFFMSFEAENTESTGVLDDALFNLKVIGYTEKGSKEIYNRTFSTVKGGLQAIVKEILYSIRKRCNYYTLELSMSTSESENVKRLRIYDLSSKALLTGHKLTKA
ncbi:MAG: hypothetical protein WC358_11025, partial [Ignavibacteria bacterium]